MLHSSTTRCMIGSHDHPSVAGTLEVSFEPRQRREPDPDPGDTVRLPAFERSIRLWPMAQA